MDTSSPTNLFSIFARAQDRFTRKVFLLENMDWVKILCLFIVGIMLYKLVMVLMQRYSAGWLHRRDIQIEAKDKRPFIRPLGLLITGLFCSFGLNVLMLPMDFTTYAQKILQIINTIFFGWCVLNGTDILRYYMKHLAEKTKSQIDDILIPIIHRGVKTLVFVLIFIAIGQALGIEMTGILAGLGIGGVAIALAAKDTISNLFGCLTVILDRPFKMAIELW